MTKLVANPLASLRSVMKSLGVQAYVVPTEDAHQSEYIAKCDNRRSFISGFTGSAGTCVITLEKAALWTDGRYFLQASQQLSEDWILQKMHLPKTPSKEDWLLEVLPKNSAVAIDSQLFTVSAAKELKEKLEEGGHSLQSITENLVDKIWTDRPAKPSGSLLVLDVKYAGVEFGEKVKAIQTYLKEKKFWGLVVSALDEIAWLFNLRGSDIAFNPVFHSYALVTPTSVTLYVDEKKIDASVHTHLKDTVQVKPYTAIFDDLKSQSSQHTKESANGPSKLLIDERCSLALLDAIGGLANPTAYKIEKSPIQKAKAIKNDNEMEGFRECHKRDAAALCRYFSWLENELSVKKNVSLSEAAAADKLETFRAQLSLFKGLSFDTISSTGPNGSIIHYKPEHGTCAIVREDQMYLCDSGGQYLDGTTDVTRTMHFGNPTDEEKDAFTRVLKGHIQLDMCVFPTGTTGYIIDCLARAPLWKAGLDFRHGTGHGVGSFLNVHEGPQSISFRPSSNETPLAPGMTITNEPGFYKDGAYGIRIENVMLVKKAETPHRFGDIDYLGFEHVTLVPIQTKLVVKSLLTSEEVDWLNKYHVKVLESISPYLNKGDEDKLALAWLRKETQAI